MKTPIRSYTDLEVYRNAYNAGIEVIKKLLPLLPPEERYDLKDQLLRSSKAIPRLIAEGYAKRHQKAGFQKYLADAMSEANETGVGLSQIYDLYLKTDEQKNFVKNLIDIYDKVARQLYRLNESWHNFKHSAETNHK